MGLFGKKYAMLTLHINARFQPKHREKYYSEPIDEMLRRAKAGKVVGGGTLLSKDGVPESCDVEIDCVKDVKEKLISILSAIPLPKGSSLIFDDTGEEIPLGELECMAVFLNGTDLPEETYKNYGIDAVVDEFLKLLGENYGFFSYWQGSRETALYFYGKSFEEMKKSTAEFIASCPLCEKCRIDQIC